MTRSCYVKAEGYCKRKILYTVGSHHVEFEIQEAVNSSWETVINGSIKWDGCSNFAYKNYMHYCGILDVLHWAGIIQCCYYICKTVLPTWDSLGDHYPWPQGYTHEASD